MAPSCCRRLRGLAVSLAFLAILPGCNGCNSRPRAPALQDERVYHSAREGLRFLVPEGWSQQARAEVPPGKVDKERLLVMFKLPGASPALLEVSLADLPESVDLKTHLAAPSFGVTKWKAAGPPASVACGDRTGLRFTFTHDRLTKEVVAVRRGERVYFLTGVFASKDRQARDEVRRTVGSVIWER